MKMKRFRKAEERNREHWDELAEVHARSYDIKALLDGSHLIDEIQLAEVGDVSGKSLLHLQCHIGTDTLSWARLGAKVTGVDISSESLQKARELARKTGLEADFIESPIYDLPNVLDRSFDIVYTSVGVLCWLSDLEAWAGLIHRYLKPGGLFYIFESHPFLMVFDDEASGLTVRYPYFHRDEPLVWPGDHPDYADPDYRVKNEHWEWSWSLGDILGALMRAGLRIELFHEHDVIPFQDLPCMVPAERKGWYKLPEEHDFLPLAFSLRAVRVA